MRYAWRARRSELSVLLALAWMTAVRTAPGNACDNFWKRPLAEQSTCFTETLECREVDGGLKRWEPASPLVIVTARSSQVPAMGATISFLQRCLSAAPARPGTEEASDCGRRLLPMVAWQYAVLTDAPDSVRSFWHALEGKAMPGNVELIHLELEILNSIPGCLRSIVRVLQERGLSLGRSRAYIVADPLQLDATLKSESASRALKRKLDSPSFAYPLVVFCPPAGRDDSGCMGDGSSERGAAGGNEDRCHGGIFGGLSRSVLEGLEYAAMAGEAAEREAANCRPERSDKAAGSCPQHPSGDVDAAIFRLLSAYLSKREQLRLVRGLGVGGGAGSSSSAGAAAASGEAGNPGRADGAGKRVVVVSVVYSQPWMLARQAASFRKHLAENITEYIVVIDASAVDTRSALLAVCHEHKLTPVMAPFQGQARRHEASWHHGQALDWAWDTLILEAGRFKSELVFITEQDVWLFAPLSLTASLLASGRRVVLGGAWQEGAAEAISFDNDEDDERTENGNGAFNEGGLSPLYTANTPRRLGKSRGRGECFMSGVGQQRPNAEGFAVEYLHPSAIVIDLESTPFVDAIRFSPMNFNGSDLDTGGSLAQYFQTVAQMREEEEGVGHGVGGGAGQPGVCLMKHEYVSEKTCFGELQHLFGLPDVYEDALLHMRCGAYSRLPARLDLHVPILIEVSLVTRKSSGWDLAEVDSLSDGEALRSAHAARGLCLESFLDGISGAGR